MQPTTQQDTSSATPSWLKIALLVTFLAAVVLTAYLTFKVVRDLVVSWQMTSLPGVAILDATPTLRPGETAEPASLAAPLQPVSGPTPPAWDGAQRVTVLIMGLDYRDWQAKEGPPRTDTMILLSLDPLTRSGAMLSIPRDLWVNIPHGFKYNRINTAYQLGEAYKYENGGGPGLAMDTVEGLLGVPIDFYAQIDFEAFIKFIDEIGGVKVNVPEKIKVDPLGGGNTKTLKPGIQTLPGDLALAYARVRKNAGDDFGRAGRQQEIIMAIRDRLLDPEVLPTMISKAPVLYQELSAGIHTNLTMDQAIKLAWLASQVPTENIKKGIIGPPDQVNFAVSAADGQQVLKPITEKIRAMRDELFTNTGPANPAAASMSPADLMKAEGARVEVLNGSATSGIAAKTMDYLKSQGLNISQTGNAEQASTYTQVTFYTGKPYTVKFLMELMKIDKIRVHYFNNPASPVDVSITLGDDWANQNPMP